MVNILVAFHQAELLAVNPTTMMVSFPDTMRSQATIRDGTTKSYMASEDVCAMWPLLRITSQEEFCPMSTKNASEKKTSAFKPTADIWLMMHEIMESRESRQGAL